MRYIVIKQEQSLSDLGVFIIVIVLIAVIGALRQSPPERPYQSFHTDNHKIQYIRIGTGDTTTKVSEN